MKKVNSSKFVIFTIALIILASPLLIYLLCLLIKTTGLYTIVPNIGSVDTWISFAGSIIGGSITMLALYFTISHDNDIKKQDQILQIRPCLVGEPIYQSKEEKVVLISTILENKTYYYMKWFLLNVTDNTAKNVKLLSEKTTFINNALNFRNNNTNEISIYTSINNERELIKPNGENLYFTHLKFNREHDYNDPQDSSYLLDFKVKHTVTFEYTDLLDLQIYTSVFSFTVLINTGNDKHLTIFLEDFSNTQISPEKDHN